MTRKMAFLAVVGLAGTGKSTFVDELTRHTGWPVIYFGGLVLAELKERGLEITPENERAVRENIRHIHGPAALAVLALKDQDLSLFPAEPIVIDGLYSYAELKYLREKLGDRLLTVAIHSSFDKRVERLEQRAHRPLTREQIVERDRTEIENIEKAQPIALAQRHFVNDGDRAELRTFVVDLVQSVT